MNLIGTVALHLREFGNQFFVKNQASEALNKSLWSALPDEMVMNIFRFLPAKDVLSCRLLEKRCLKVIDDKLLVAQSYWNQYPVSLDPESYSPEKYQNEWRSWLKGFNSPRVQQLDDLTDRRHFSRALFFTISKTIQNAWPVALKMKLETDKQALPFDIDKARGCGLCQADEFSEKSFTVKTSLGTRIVGQGRSFDINWTCSSSPDGNSQLLAFAPDKSWLIVKDEYEQGQWVIAAELPVCFDCYRIQHFSPDSSKLVTFDLNINGDKPIIAWIMSHEGKDKWVKRLLVPFKTQIRSFTFSPNSKYVVIFSYREFKIIECSRVGESGKATEVASLASDNYSTLTPCGACFSPDSSSVALVYTKCVQIMGKREGKWVKKAVINFSGQPLSIFDVHKVWYEGRSLIVSVKNRYRIFYIIAPPGESLKNSRNSPSLAPKRLGGDG